MASDTKWIPQGVIPAVLLPFHEDLSIDVPSFRAHLRDVASVEGLSAITVNAHSTEVASCSFDEQKGVLAIAKDEIGERLPIVHGVYAEGSLGAARRPKLSAQGCHGVVSGSGSVIADLQARLFRAVRANDLATARQINDRIWPTAEVFYSEPWVDMHNRMKEALVMMGKLPRAVVRPPLVKIPQAEIERIRKALIAAGLLDRAGRSLRAA